MRETRSPRPNADCYEVMSEASNKQAAAWRLADSMLKRGNTEKLPTLKGCKSDVECATACNNFFMEKIEKLVSNVQTSSATGKTMASARDFIKSIARETPPFELNCVGIATIRSMGTGEYSWILT